MILVNKIKEYAMEKITQISSSNPAVMENALSVILREGARRLLKEAVELEVADFLEKHRACRTGEGAPAAVRNGYLPTREIQTGLGPIEIQVPRTRDRSDAGQVFKSLILPPYLKRTKSVEAVIPWLYLKGISSNDVGSALEALLGSHAKGLSASNVLRLKESWKMEWESFQKRDLSKKRYVYFWVDGIYLEARLEQRQCVLVIIGADASGKKELVGLSGGFRESELSWKSVLLDLKERGLEMGPELCTGDGALGFWKALPQVYGKATPQRCWVHKTANILNKLPRGLQRKAKQGLQEIWGSETKAKAEKAFKLFLKTYGAKYPKAAACLTKDREALLAFYAFPAEHWQSLRTTNPIESVFATVRLRTEKTKGCLSLESAEMMTFRLIQEASKRWIRLKGAGRLAEVIRGVPFGDGIKQTNPGKKAQKCAA